MVVRSAAASGASFLPYPEAGDELQRHLVQFFGPKCDVDDGARAEVELGAVVAKLSNDLVGHRVGEDGVRRAAVERPAAQREEETLLYGREGRKGSFHLSNPFSVSQRQIT